MRFHYLMNQETRSATKSGARNRLPAARCASNAAGALRGLSVGLVMTLTCALAMGADEPILDLRFDEGAGTNTANAGTSGGDGELQSVTFSTNVPTGEFAPADNASSIDMATDGTERRVYYTVPTASPTIGLQTFTLTGWINVMDPTTGAGGSRVISTWPGDVNSANVLWRSGFDLVYDSDNRLRLGINQAGDYPTPPEGPFSSSGTVPVSVSGAAANWTFFAITYDAKTNDFVGDPTFSGSDGVVEYFFGSGSAEAAPDSLNPQTYDSGGHLGFDRRRVGGRLYAGGGDSARGWAEVSGADRRTEVLRPGADDR